MVFPGVTAILDSVNPSQLNLQPNITQSFTVQVNNTNVSDPDFSKFSHSKKNPVFLKRKSDFLDYKKITIFSKFSRMFDIC